MSIPNVPILFTMDSVSSRPAVDRDQHDVIHLGGESAVVLPMYEYRRLRALEPANGAWPLEHSVVASLAWTALLLAVFVPLCTARYARPE
jgi:hypothetical protein